MSDVIYVLGLGLICIVFSAHVARFAEKDFSFIKMKRGPKDRWRVILLRVVGYLGIIAGIFICLIPVLFF